MGRFSIKKTGKDGDSVSTSRFSITKDSVQKKENISAGKEEVNKETEKKSSASFFSSLPAYQRALSAYTPPKISTNVLSLPIASKTTTTQNIGTGALKAELADRRASGNFTMPGSHESRVKELEAHSDTVRSQLQTQFQPLDYKGTQIGKWDTTAAQLLNSSLSALAQEAAQESFLADLDRLSTRTTGRPGNISLEDFLSKSTYTTTKNGDSFYDPNSQTYIGTGFDDILYDYINRNKEAIAIQTNNELARGQSILGFDSGYLKQMTDEEVGIFNYLYSQIGKDAAYDYISEIKSGLNARQRAYEEGLFSDAARSNPVEASIYSVLTSPTKGLSYVGQFANYIAGEGIDQNSSANRFSYQNSAIRGEVSKIAEENWGAPGSFLYNTGMSMADFLFATALSGGFGAAPGTAAAKASSGLALTIMGTGAAADTVIASKDRGLSDDQAFALGTIAGLAEVATEKFSLDALLKDPKNAVLFVLQNAGVEASEETLSSLINFVADRAISGNDSEWNVAINNYISHGYSEKEAKENAFWDQFKSIALDALGGALSGGVLSGARVGANAIYNRASGAHAVDAGSPIIQNQYATDTEAQQQTQTDPLQALAEEMAAKEAEEIFPTVEERPRPKPQESVVVSEQQQQETVPKPSWEKYTGAPRADGTNPAAQARTAARQAAESADLASMNTAERESFLQAYDMGRSGESFESDVSALPVQSEAVYGAFFQGQDDYFSGSADRYQAYRTAESSRTEGPVLDTRKGTQPVDLPVAGQKNTASIAETGTHRMTMEDFTEVNSPVWNNVEYGDTETQSQITRQTHQAMVEEGAVVTVPEGTMEQVGQSYPDLRGMKKAERTPILRQKMKELKASLRQFLNGLKGGTYEFEVNGNILEAKLYDTGVREVLEKIDQSKASMLYHSDQVFQNARYLYSTPDYDGNPNVYRWNYFYTPVQIGDEIVGVRIAVRDMVETRDGRPESQIYNWGIKKSDAALGGGKLGTSAASPGTSSAASSGVALDGGRPSTKPPSSGVSSAAPDGMTLGTSASSVNPFIPSIPQSGAENNINAEQIAPRTLPIADQAPPSAPSKKQGIQIPIDERTWQDAGNRKVNAFQYDNPELHPYFVEAAKALQYDLAASVKGERLPVYDASSETGKDIIGFTGTKRSVTEPIAQALDNANLSYAQIEKALSDLIADNGQENYAAAKKVELVLDDMLTNGYTNSDGQYVPPNQEYIAARDAASGAAQGSTEYRMSEEEWNSLLTQEPDGPVMMPVADAAVDTAAARTYDNDTADQPSPERNQAAAEINPDGSPVYARTKAEANIQPTDLGALKKRQRETAQQLGLGRNEASSVKEVGKNGSVGKEAGGNYGNGGPQKGLYRAGDAAAPGTSSADAGGGMDPAVYGAARYRGRERDGVLPQRGESTDAGDVLVKGDPEGSVGAAPKEFDSRSSFQSTVDAVLLPVKQGDGRENSVGAKRSDYEYQQKRSKVGSNTFSKVYQEVLDQMEENGGNVSDLPYDVVSERKSMENAQQRLSVDFEGEVSDLPNRDAWSSEDLDTAMGVLDRYMSDALKTGNYDKVNEWARLIQSKGTNAGQMIQAFAKYTRTPQGVMVDAVNALDKSKLSAERKSEILSRVQEQIAFFDSIQEGDTGSLIDLIKQNSAIRRTGTFFRNQTSNALNAALEADSYEHLRDVALAQIDNIAKDYQPRTTAEKLRSARYMAMLSNIATVLRNLVSNLVFDPVDSFAGNTFVVPLDAFLSKFTGTRSVAAENPFSLTKWRGAIKNASRAYIETALDVSTEGVQNRYDQTSSRTFKMTGNPLERFLSTWSKYQGYSLNVTDEFTKGGVRAETQRRIDSLKERGLIKDDTLDNRGAEQAKYRTFQDDTRLSRTMLQARNGLNNLGTEGFGSGDLLMPFAHVASNLVTRAVEYSPLGLANGTAELIGVLQKAHNGTLTAAEQARAVSDIGRGMSGTVLIAAFGALAASGLIRVAGNGDGEEDKTALETSEGISGTQLNLSGAMRWIAGEENALEWRDGDQLMSIGFLEPLNAQMTTGALLAEDLDGTDTPAELFGNFLKSSFEGTVQSLLDLPAMSSLQDLANGYSYSTAETTGGKAADALTSYAASQVSSFVPNIVRSIARASDPYVRDVYSSGTIDGEAVDIIKNSLPVLRNTLPIRQTPFGEDRTYGDNQVMNALNAVILPGAITQYRTSDAAQELYSLPVVEGTPVYPRRNAPNSVSNEGTTYDLTYEQKTQYQKDYGQAYKSVIESLMEQPSYQSATDKEKTEMLNMAREYASELAKTNVLQGIGVSYTPEGWIGGAMKSGVPETPYLLYRFSADEDNNDTISQSESAVALLPIRGLTDQQKGRVWQSQNSSWSEEKNPFTGALANAGIDPELATEIMQKYSEIDNASYEGESVPRQKQTALSQYLDGLDLTPEQRAVVDDTYKFYTMFPADPIPYSIETMSDAAQERWPAAQAWGMNEEEFLKYYPIRAQSGKGITKEVKLRQLQEAGMTAQQDNYFWDITK